MKLLVGGFLFFSLGLLSLPAQVPSDAASDVGRMESVLKEAGELQATEPQSVAEKLAPLLTELRQLREGGTLKPDTSRIFNEG